MTNNLQVDTDRRPGQPWRSPRPTPQQYAPRAYRAVTADVSPTPTEFRLARSESRALSRADSIFQRLLAQTDRLFAIGVSDAALMHFEVVLGEYRERRASAARGRCVNTAALFPELLEMVHAVEVAQLQVHLAAPSQRAGALRRFAELSRREIALRATLVPSAEAEADAMDAEAQGGAALGANVNRSAARALGIGLVLATAAWSGAGCHGSPTAPVHETKPDTVCAYKLPRIDGTYLCLPAKPVMP